jgi:radical SAM protein (TIGR01212 family)
LKRYRDYNSYLRDLFGERVQKIPLDAGFSCPNRDGTLSKRGCIYCDSRGSGTGVQRDRGLSVGEQIRQGRRFGEKRYHAKKFIAYFQSFSNTYAPVSRLKTLYDEAVLQKGVVGLSVATRPDCISPEILDLLCEYRKDFLVWIEYGLQSAHDTTLSSINRGHDAACFEEAVRRTTERQLSVCAHVVLGLPGETREMMLQTASFIAGLGVQGVKIHQLYVVRGTPLESLYRRGEYRGLKRDTYVNLAVDFLERIPPDMVIQRLTGDPVPSELVAPEWSREKTENLNLIRRRLEERGTWQGKEYEEKGAEGPRGSGVQVTGKNKDA